MSVGHDPGSRPISRCRRLDGVWLLDVLLCLEIDRARGKREPGEISFGLSAASRGPCKAEGRSSRSTAAVIHMRLAADRPCIMQQRSYRVTAANDQSRPALKSGSACSAGMLPCQSLAATRISPMRMSAPTRTSWLDPSKSSPTGSSGPPRWRAKKASVMAM
jgi:hypothetical protein